MYKLNFQPFPGLGSNHLQMILPNFRPLLFKKAPPSKNCLIKLDDGAYLSCKLSTPRDQSKNSPTVVLVHGMGGSDSSTYMIRISKKLYENKIESLRVNLRGSGPGKGLSKLPYHGGTSNDLLNVIEFLKEREPNRDIIIIGISLGGNITLKLAGELGVKAKNLVKHFIAVCCPLDLAQTVETILQKQNQLYHFYYLKSISRQAKAFLPHKISNLYEFDDLITAPLWGYKGADEYYQKCSSIHFLKNIRQSTHLLFAKDDPFIPLDPLLKIDLPNTVQVYTTDQGSHVGFLGKVPKSTSPYWMDHLLLNWVRDDFTSNLV